MFYSLPPAPPALVQAELSPRSNILLVASECKKGSRDCFPADRVGFQAGEGWVMASKTMVINPVQGRV